MSEIMGTVRRPFIFYRLMTAVPAGLRRISPTSPGHFTTPWTFGTRMRGSRSEIQLEVYFIIFCHLSYWVKIKVYVLCWVILFFFRYDFCRSWILPIFRKGYHVRCIKLYHLFCLQVAWQSFAQVTVAPLGGSCQRLRGRKYPRARSHSLPAELAWGRR